MRTLAKTTLILAPMLMLSACGKYSKAPVSNIATMRENAKASDVSQGNIKVVPQIVPVTKTVDRIVNQKVMDETFLKINPDAASMTFIEGQSASYTFETSILKPGLILGLTAKNLPDGATLVKSTKKEDIAKGIYILTWKAPLYSVPASDMSKTISVTLVGQVANPTPDIPKNIVLNKDITLQVVHDQAPLAALVVEGLDAKVAEGSITPFDIVAVIPGIDGDTSVKPRLIIINYMDLGTAAKQTFLEMNGAVNVLADSAHPDPEYVGDSKWKFHFLFDTKNQKPPVQLNKDHSVSANADGVRVRFSVQALSPFQASSQPKTIQLKIVYATAPVPAAAATPAPVDAKDDQVKVTPHLVQAAEIKAPEIKIDPTLPTLPEAK